MYKQVKEWQTPDSIIQISEDGTLTIFGQSSIYLPAISTETLSEIIIELARFKNVTKEEKEVKQ